MTTIFRSAYAAALALVLFSTDPALPQAQRSPEPATFFGLTFPATIAGAERFDVRDYEQTNPGLGYSAGYRRSGLVGTVYIYDVGQRTIPDDLQAPAIKAQFEQAKAEISQVQRGMDAKVELKENFIAKDGRGQNRLLCAAFMLVPTGGAAARESVLCLGTVNSKFIKFRITTSQQAADESRRFLAAWVQLLWPPR